jgi:predicted O-methyltransferase YrrM
MIKKMKRALPRFPEPEKTWPEPIIPSLECMKPDLWRCYNEAEPEIEVLGLLHQLVLTLKPDCLLETGSKEGRMTEALAAAIQRNGFGTLWACDTDLTNVEKTRERIVGAKLTDHVVTFHGAGTSLIYTATDIDFAFIDSGEAQERMDEFRMVLPKMPAGGVVIVHDTGSNSPYIRRAFTDTANSLCLPYVMLDTPRGVAIVRKG